MESNQYEKIDFDNADELWEELSPTRNFGLKPPYSLLYRGQGDASWGLIPSSLRMQHIEKSFFPEAFEADLTKSIIKDEILSIAQFAIYCDRVGIKIPGDSESFRQQYIGINSSHAHLFIDHPQTWPPRVVFDLLAMAQHHGVATRLLDWSTLAYTACYFAASSSVANYKHWTKDSKLAIWVLNAKILKDTSSGILFDAPGSTSPNLAAQYGKFTIYPPVDRYESIESIKGLEYFLGQYQPPVLFRLTIPSSESARLLGLCSIAGFSAADIYPSTDGAGLAVRDDRNIQAARHYYMSSGGIPYNSKKVSRQ
ncbi:FRG domain-containing protein [Pantoea ananatis]|nr:FRG domain-containing protein [Pantoea ananatis]